MTHTIDSVRQSRRLKNIGLMSLLFFAAIFPMRLLAQTPVITIDNYAAQINQSLSGLGVPPELTPIYGRVINVVGNNGAGTFNGMNGLTPQGTGVAGVAGYSTSMGTLTTSATVAVGTGTLTQETGKTITIEWHPYVATDGMIHVAISMVIKENGILIADKKGDRATPIPASYYNPDYNANPPAAPKTGTATNSTSGGVGVVNGGVNGTTATGSTGSPSADQLLYFNGPGGGVYDCTHQTGGYWPPPTVFLGWYE